jgi:ATP-binding cassette subfamily B protein
MSQISAERKQELLNKYSSTASNTAGGQARRGFGGGGGGPRRGVMTISKPKNAGVVINRLIAYVGSDKLKILLVFALVLGDTFASLGSSYILRPVINNLVDLSRPAQEKIRNLLICILIMAGIYFVGLITSYLHHRIMINVSQNALVKVREDLFSKIQTLPVKFHDTHTHGEIMSRFTNDLDIVGNMINTTVSHIFAGIVSLIGTVLFMFITNWILAVVTITTVPMLIFAGGQIAKRSRRYYKGQQQSLGAVNGYIEESITGQKVVKVFCHEETTMEEFDFLSDDLYGKQVKASFFGGIMGPVMGNLSQVSYALSAVVGGILCLTSNFDIGGLTIFTRYSRQFARPINELSSQVNTIFSALAGAERVFEVMDEIPETADPADAVAIYYEDQPADTIAVNSVDDAADTAAVYSRDETADAIAAGSEDNLAGKTWPIRGEVTLRNVTFGYTPDKTVLKNINVTAQPGQKVAFVGSTGAGKTTITNLINRFYEIEEGQITIDGIDIRNIKKDSLRGSIAMVLQDTHLFSGTVIENIRYGRLDATDEEVMEAAKTANAHSFIERLENGYDTVLEGDGSNLSQGQRQLLNIARAAVSKAPILILDEATSSVDTRTEKQIERGIDRLMKNRTTFVIAHRLSTVRNSNKIIVLEHGEIVEQGTHEELLKMRGRYYQLYTGATELD